MNIREWFGKAFGWVNGPGRAAAFGVLTVLVVLFGRDVVSSWRVRGDIHRLRQTKQSLEESIAADSILLEKLDDADFLERFARENYLMRKEGETVYIITD